MNSTPHIEDKRLNDLTCDEVKDVQDALEEAGMPITFEMHHGRARLASAHITTNSLAIDETTTCGQLWVLARKTKEAQRKEFFAYKRKI